MQLDREQWESFLLKIIRWGIFAIFFTPLVVYARSFFLFVTPKTIYFRILTEIVFLAYLILLLISPKYRFKSNVLSLTVFLFLFVIVITSIFGINPQRSFWSTYERMTGIFTLFHLLAFYIVLVAVFRDIKDWENLFILSISVGLILSFVVASQLSPSMKGGGTIGNTSFMAAYLLFDIFFAIALLFSGSFAKRLFAFLSLLIMLSVFFTSTARGAIASFFLGLFLMLLVYWIFSGKRKLVYLSAFLSLFLLFAAVFSFVLKPPFFVKFSHYLQKQMEPRIVVWHEAWRGIKERPLLGWGLENFNVVFLKYFNPCLFTPRCGGEAWFDRVHNVVLEMLIDGGVFLLISYLAIFGVAVFLLMKLYLREKNSPFSQEKAYSLITAILLLSYLAQNTFVFDMISSYFIFFFALSFVHFLWGKYYLRGEEQEGKVVKGNKSWLLAVALFFLFLPIFYFGNIQPLQGATNIVKVIYPSSNLSQTISAYRQSSNMLLMGKYELREQFAQKVERLSFDGSVRVKEKALLKKAFQLAEEGLEKSVQENKLDFRPRIFLGKLYFSDFLFSQEKKKLVLAQKTLREAFRLSPLNERTFWDLGRVDLSSGRIKEGLRMFQFAIKMEPHFAPSHLYLAMAYGEIGDYKNMEKELSLTSSYGYHWKEQLPALGRVIFFYEKSHNDKKLIPLYQDVLKINPRDVRTWMKLAAAFANLGNKGEAEKAALEASKIDPSLVPQVNKFISQLEE